MTGLENLTAEELLQMACDGNEEAYGPLFQHFRAMFLQEGAKYRHLMITCDIEDLVQEGNILLWRMVQRGSFKGGTLEGYVRTSVRNHFIGLYRAYCARNPISIGVGTDEQGNPFTVVAEANFIKDQRERQRQYSKAYYQKKREENPARPRLTAEEKREKRMAKCRDYYYAHRDEINARKRLQRLESKPVCC